MSFKKFKISIALFTMSVAFALISVLGSQPTVHAQTVGTCSDGSAPETIAMDWDSDFQTVPVTTVTNGDAASGYDVTGAGYTYTPVDIYTLDAATGMYTLGADGVNDMEVLILEVFDPHHINGSGTGSAFGVNTGVPAAGEPTGTVDFSFGNEDDGASCTPLTNADGSSNANWSYAMMDVKFLGQFGAVTVADGTDFDWESINGSNPGYELGYATLNGAGNASLLPRWDTNTGLDPVTIDCTQHPNTPTLGSYAFGAAGSLDADGGLYTTGVYGMDFVNGECDNNEPNNTSGDLWGGPVDAAPTMGLMNTTNVSQMTFFYAYSALGHLDVDNGGADMCLDSDGTPIGRILPSDVAYCAADVLAVGMNSAEVNTPFTPDPTALSIAAILGVLSLFALKIGRRKEN